VVKYKTLWPKKVNLVESKLSKSSNAIPANRRVVDELYAHGKISFEAKEYALAFLYPADKWGIWASRLLLVVGAALVLSGVVYFFAFNWAKISPVVKLTVIQAAMVGCILGVYICSLKQLFGQILLLSASVLTGVFMAVFGQIYQTGADAYQLFMMWSILTLGWTIVSNFAPQWLFWLVIANTFLILWWNQAFLPTGDIEHSIFVLLSALNGSALAMKECFSSGGSRKWLQVRWLRVALTVATLLPLLIPTLIFVMSPSKASVSLGVASMVGVIGHGLIYIFYRYSARDMWSLALVVLSACIIVEVSVIKSLSELLDDAEFLMFLIMGVATLGIFTFAVVILRHIIDIFEVEHD